MVETIVEYVKNKGIFEILEWIIHKGSPLESLIY